MLDMFELRKRLYSASKVCAHGLGSYSLCLAERWTLQCADSAKRCNGTDKELFSQMRSEGFSFRIRRLFCGRVVWFDQKLLKKCWQNATATPSLVSTVSRRVSNCPL